MSASTNGQFAVPGPVPPPLLSPGDLRDLRDDVVAGLIDQGFTRALATSACACSNATNFDRMFRDALLWLRSNRPGGPPVPATPAKAGKPKLLCRNQCGRQVNKNNRLQICGVCRKDPAFGKESAKASPERLPREIAPRTIVHTSAPELPAIGAPVVSAAVVSSPVISAPLVSSSTIAAPTKDPDEQTTPGAKTCPGFSPDPNLAASCGRELSERNSSGLCPPCYKRRLYFSGRLARKPAAGRAGIIPAEIPAGRFSVLLSEAQIDRFLDGMFAGNAVDWKAFVRLLPANLKLALVNHYFANNLDEASAEAA